MGDVTPVITAPFSYAVDDLSLIRNGTEFFNDTFSGAPTGFAAAAHLLSTPIVYFTNGSTSSESGGKAILSSTGVAPTNTGTG